MTNANDYTNEAIAAAEAYVADRNVDKTAFPEPYLNELIACIRQQDADTHERTLQQEEQLKRMSGGLAAAIRAAKLALFVINKAGVMPNSSWACGFEKDMKTAEAAREGGEA